MCASSPAARLRAAVLGEYRSCSIASSTAARVDSRTLRPLLTTRETVIADTPAARATSSIVTAPRPRRLGLAIPLPRRRLLGEARRQCKFARVDAARRGATLALP